MVKYFFLSMLACAPAFYICTLSVSPWVSLSVGVVSAFALYLGLLRRDEHMKACVEVLMEAVGKRK